MGDPRLLVVSSDYTNLPRIVGTFINFTWYVTGQCALHHNERHGNRTQRRCKVAPKDRATNYLIT
jgi:hypothetical protein